MKKVVTDCFQGNYRHATNAIQSSTTLKLLHPWTFPVQLLLGALIEQKTPSWIHYCLNSHLQDAISPQILDSQENIENESRPKIHCTWNLVVGAANHGTVLNLDYIVVSKFEGGTT